MKILYATCLSLKPVKLLTKHEDVRKDVKSSTDPENVPDLSNRAQAFHQPTINLKY